MNDRDCHCLHEPMNFDQYRQIRFVGVDETNGRFGEVQVLFCKTCGRFWLHYSVEYEAFTASGRYFMGLITPEAAGAITAGAAVEYLNQLDWHLYGGSYFQGRKGRSTGKVNVDGV